MYIIWSMKYWLRTSDQQFVGHLEAEESLLDPSFAADAITA